MRIHKKQVICFILILIFRPLSGKLASINWANLFMYLIIFEFSHIDRIRDDPEKFVRACTSVY